MGNLHFIKDEMLVHIPVCTHANPKSILIIGGCENIKAEVEKHKSISNILEISEENAQDEVAKLDENSFDIIVIATDKFTADRVFLGLLNRALTTKGLISIISARLLTEENKAQKELEALGEIFKIVMPYRYEASAHGTGLACRNTILASHTYHPTADINLQRADLTDGFKYYNSDIAIGAFHLPTVVRERFLGLIKL